MNLFKLRNFLRRKYLELRGVEGNTSKCAYPLLPSKGFANGTVEERVLNLKDLWFEQPFQCIKT